MKNKDSAKGLMLVAVMFLLLALSGSALVRLNSLILQVGTTRWIRYDYAGREFTIGGADGTLSFALENASAFQNFLESHNYQVPESAISNDFLGTGPCTGPDCDSPFYGENITGTFTFRTSTPIIAGTVPGFEAGKYCYKKYFVNVEGILENHNVPSGQQPQRIVKHLLGAFIIGPTLCE